MTLSNFDWTDKNSVKWFILLPTGHEGPYSMNQLLQMKDNKKIAPHVTIWAEGISVPKTLAEIEKEIFEEKLIETDELPLLPEEDIPPLPVDELYPVEKKPLKNPKWIFIVLGILGLLFFFFTHIVTKRESGLVIKRHPKMSLNLLQRIEKENAFKGWEAPLFFKEYLPGDHSQIWLVTSSFHECDVEASFQSIKDKLLSPSEESISFRSKAPLSGHVV